MATKLTTYTKRQLQDMTPKLKEQAMTYNEMVRTMRRMKRHIDKQLEAERSLWRAYEGAQHAQRKDGEEGWDYIERWRTLLNIRCF